MHRTMHCCYEIMFSVYLDSCKDHNGDTKFHCSSDRMCIPLFKKCNGRADCPSGEDENNCS